MEDFSESVALVTGANRGIGLEVARQLARLGFKVILGSRDARRGEGAAEELARGGLKVFAGRLDVTDERGIEDLRRRVAERRGRLDALVNNAAVLYDTWQRAENADLDTVREAFETNTPAEGAAGVVWATTLTDAHNSGMHLTPLSRAVYVP